MSQLSYSFRETMPQASWRKMGAFGMAAFSLVAILATGSSLLADIKKKQTHAKATVSPAAPVKAYGSKNAPITMEIFTDYQCPTCGAFFEQTLRPLINDYVASGKVYVIHRDFPLQMHQYSGQAARWANAAAEIGQFESVEAALYDNQAAWTASGDLEKYISGALSANDFKRVQKLMEGCTQPGPVASPNRGIALAAHPCAVDAFIVQDLTLGNQLPVTGTPTFVISSKGQRLPAGSGLVTWAILKKFFDSLLAQQ